MSPLGAAEKGYVDDVIDPGRYPAVLVQSLTMFAPSGRKCPVGSTATSRAQEVTLVMHRPSASASPMILVV